MSSIKRETNAGPVIAAAARRSVVILSTAKATKGGVSAVINAYESGDLFRRWPSIHLATHRDGTTVQKWATALIAFLKFVRLVTSRRVLLVHVHSASDASFWRKSAFVGVSLFAQCPVIFHLHGGGFTEFYERRCGPVRRWSVRYVLNHVAAIVVLTDEWRSRVSAITRNENIDVICNPVARPVLNLKTTDRRNDVVLFIGRLEKKKGIFELVEAIEVVQKRFSEVKLWLAGEGNLDALMFDIAKRGLSGAVQYFGWVNGEEKCRLLREATICVLPSYVEGLPMAILEAMAAGLPIVASRVGGIPNVVENGVNGFLVPPGDARAVADAICRLFAEPELRKLMGAASRQKINERFLPEQIASEIDALYRKVASVRCRKLHDGPKGEPPGP